MGENGIHGGADALVMDTKDHVATLIRDIVNGASVTYDLQGMRKQIVSLDDIAFGHKIAIVDIPKGTHVHKYGEVIGQAVEDIAAGQHVHVHNMEGLRGRGDQVKTADNHV